MHIFPHLPPALALVFKDRQVTQVSQMRISPGITDKNMGKQNDLSHSIQYLSDRMQVSVLAATYCETAWMEPTESSQLDLDVPEAYHSDSLLCETLFPSFFFYKTENYFDFNFFPLQLMIQWTKNQNKRI